jgi:hypothetical protein
VEFEIKPSVGSASYLAENGQNCLRTLVAFITNAGIRPVFPGAGSDDVGERVHFKQSNISIKRGENLFSSNSVATELYVVKHFFIKKCTNSALTHDYQGKPSIF